MNSFRAVVFDAYGTLFDVASVAEECDREYPGLGTTIGSAWRRRQLEHTWCRSLMKRYMDFESLTRDALESTLQEMDLKHTPEQLERLSARYLALRPFPDARRTLVALRSAKQRLAILSNGTGEMLQEVLRRAGLSPFFERVVSVEKVRSYKPDPRVYSLAMKELRLPARRDVLYVSGNEWDVAGSKSFGFTAVWVNRRNARHSEWPEFPPDYEIRRLSDLINLTQDAR